MKLAITLISILLIIIGLLFVGCSENIDDGEEVSFSSGVEDLQTISDDINQRNTEKESESPSNEDTSNEGECKAEWMCISSSMRAYHKSDCSWTNKERCGIGCFNGTCQKAKTCTSGFKCKNDNEKGYQMESCEWIKRTKCDYGCKNGDCLNETESKNSTETTESNDNEDTTTESVGSTLNTGDEITINEKIFRIYLLEEERVQLKLDDQKSNWIAEDESFAFSDGTTIIVKEILFQIHFGGTKAIVYELK